MIYDDYIDYCEKYEALYGPKTVVFMQVGDFFELYAVQNETEKKGADIYRICEYCNIQVSRKNKTVLENSRQNPLMAGFPIATISKFIQLMVSQKYTCVLIRQVTPPPNPKREVTEIISPSTTLQVQTHEGNYLMVVYWEPGLLHVGISALDVTTGKSWVYEAYSNRVDSDFSKDEVHRFVTAYQPKEVVHMGTLPLEQQQEIEDMYSSPSTHYIWNQEKLRPFLTPTYQNAVLEKVFGKGILSPIETLHLERFLLATIAYTYMIQFAYEHNETIVKKLEPPTPWKNQTHLVLEATAANQLNILANSQGETPLLTLLNRTSTAFGSRLFRDRLLYPIISKTELEARYEMLEQFRKGDLYLELIPLFQSILDLERLQRKMCLGKLLPCEWHGIHTSLTSAQTIFSKTRPELLDDLMDIISYYSNILNLEECGKYNLTDIYTSLFQQGIYPEIDEIRQALASSFQFMNQLCHKLSSLGSGESTLCRLDCNEKDGYHLTSTKKRWEAIQQTKIPIEVEGTSIHFKDCKAKPISSSSSVLRISHPKMDEVSDNILLLQRKLSILNLEAYKDFLTTFYDLHHSLLSRFVATLAEMDVAVTNARNSVEYHYHRPTILDHHASSVKAKELRHPIIERMATRTEYVSNDIELGTETTPKGLLLYGINASGKSSFMKSIGLNVMMAQAGMYVAASQFELTPYHHLFTRISGMDNIYRGLSTFTVEMLELKNILARCDEHSLILGDELCSGTEAVSAISIVAAGVHELLEKRATFIFATHLHELLEIPFIQASPSIQVSHMHIELDPETGKIIYDRTLKPGNGSTVYGIEVCRFLKMSPGFLETANSIRKKIQRVPLYLIEPKASPYNPSVYVSQCEICGRPARDTHHIRPQKDADAQTGFIRDSYIHKDHSCNIIVLCEECHQQQHNGTAPIVEKKRLTSEGIELVTSQPPAPAPTQTIDPESLAPYLLLDRKGWHYRTNASQPWKKLRTSEKVFALLQKKVPQSQTLPRTNEDIQRFLEENRSTYLSFAT